MDTEKNRPDRRAARGPIRPGLEIHPRKRLERSEEENDPLLVKFLGGNAPDYPSDFLWQPIVDVRETKDEMVVKAESTNVQAEKLDITVVADVLRLKGERKPEELQKGESYRRRERSFGAFDNSLILPEEADEKKASAVYKNGILTITLPKKKKALLFSLKNRGRIPGLFYPGQFSRIPVRGASGIIIYQYHGYS